MQNSEGVVEIINYSEVDAERYRKLKLIADKYETNLFIEREDRSDDEQRELELSQRDKNRLLRTLLLLPYNHLWIMMQHFGVIILTCITLASLGITKFTSKTLESLVTPVILLDAFYSLDFFLSLIYRQWPRL